MVLLFLWSSSAAVAAPDDCRDGFLSLHVANIVNGTPNGRFNELSERDYADARDPRQGCLLWLRVENSFWVARITEGDFASWRTCEIHLRWEDPMLSVPENQPSPSQFQAQGDAAFAMVLLDYIEERGCRIYAVMMADGSMGLFLPPRNQLGESHWAIPSAALMVPKTIDLPLIGERLAPLLQLAFAETGTAPLVIGPRGGVFEISGQLIARFIGRRGAESVRRAVCQPDASALGAPHLTDVEIVHLTGGDLSDRDSFIRLLIGPPTTSIDIRAVSTNC